MRPFAQSSSCNAQIEQLVQEGQVQSSREMLGQWIDDSEGGMVTLNLQEISNVWNMHMQMHMQPA